MSLGLVTCAQLPEPDPDEAPLLDALAARGVRVELVPWDDPVADPGDHDLCVLRSCWNYPLLPRTFLDWVERAAARTRVLNPPGVVRWNLHKGYLRELEAAGVPVVPTAFVERGEAVDLAALLAERGWSDVVVKPAVSAASYRTERFGPGAVPAGQRFLAELAGERDAMVQEYQPSVEADGERALVWIDGEVTHAVAKSPRFTGADESVSGALEPTAAELAVVGAALALVREPPLYARVDVMPGPDGRPRVSELELVEPSLFLLQHPPALERLVDALLRELAG